MAVTIIVIQIVVLVFSVIVHEISHGYVAYRLGDMTAKDAGRLTFNPISHIDPVGSIVVPALLVFLHGPIFGWAKPVPINPVFFKKPEKGMMIVALAGPASNILMIIAATILLKITFMVPVLNSTGTNLFFSSIIIINAVLAFINMVPLPGLDGSRVLTYFLPYNMKEKFYKMERYTFIIFGLVVFTGAFAIILKPGFFVLLQSLKLVFGDAANETFAVYQLSRFF